MKKNKQKRKIKTKTIKLIRIVMLNKCDRI